MSNFQKVSAMNVAFGNPKGEPFNFNVNKVRNQCLNIVDELGELFVALGADKTAVKSGIASMKYAANHVSGPMDLTKTRDALCDINVFTYGAHHLMGINADADMDAVVAGVMTRFIKDDFDKKATQTLHAAKGVTDVYFEGEYPTMIMKSASDQPDAPKGKFLKSFSYRDTVFPPI